MKVGLTWRGLNAQYGIATEEQKAIHVQEEIQRSRNSILIMQYWFLFPHWKKNVQKIFHKSWQRTESILLAFSNNLNVHVFQTCWIMLGNKVMWQWGKCFSCESFQVVAVKLQKHEFFVTESVETSAWIGQEIAMVTFLGVPKILSGLFAFSFDGSSWCSRFVRCRTTEKFQENFLLAESILCLSHCVVY